MKIKTERKLQCENVLLCKWQQIVDVNISFYFRGDAAWMETYSQARTISLHREYVSVRNESDYSAIMRHMPFRLQVIDVSFDVRNQQFCDFSHSEYTTVTSGQNAELC